MFENALKPATWCFDLVARNCKNGIYGNNMESVVHSINNSFFDNVADP